MLYNSATPYRDRVLADGAVAYWRLDEASGNFIDEVSGIVGTPSGGITRGQTGALAEGNAAALFDGTSGIISATVPALAAGAPFSLEIWANGTVGSGLGILTECYPGAAYPLLMFDPSITRVYFDPSAAVEMFATASASVWHHFVGAYDGVNARLYVDGVLAAGPTAASSPLSDTNFRIGARGNGTSFFKGALDEAVLYPVALTAPQVAAHYALRTALPGPTKAMMYAQGGVARGGATRGGYHSSRVAVSVGGIQRAYAKPTASHKIEGLTIQLTNSETPNKASFQAVGWTPVTGMEVIVTLGSVNRLRRLFGGSVLAVNATNIGDIAVHQAECVDWTWALDGDPVYGHYTGSASDIALQLMSEYAPAGFTVRQVEAGLPTLTNGITFTGVKLSTALKRLAKRAGVRQSIDERKDLYFRATKAPHWTNPTNIVSGLDTFKRFRVARDLSQIANLVPFVGGGANTLSDVAVGDTILPLTDAPDWWYGDVGGVVLSGPQRITCTARVEGGGGSVVGPGVAPSNAPVLALGAGTGVTSGAHDVTVVWKTATGRTMPGPTATIIVGLVSAPSSGPVAGTPTAGTGPDYGAHQYAVTELTAAGETTPSPLSAAITTAPTAAPSYTPGLSQIVSGAGHNQWAIGASVYTQVTHLTAVGETTGSAASATVVQVAEDPVLNPGYAATLLIHSLTLPTDPEVTSRRLYFNVNGAWAGYLTLNPANTYQYFGFAGAPTLTAGSPPGVSTAARNVVPLTGLVASSPLGTARKLYGTAAGGSQLKLVATLNTTDTTYSVTTTDAGLGANAPTTNTATANQIAAAGVSIGPSGTTDRELYMSPAGGGARKLALTIANNTATTGTITISDATLASQLAEPSGGTSGLTQPTGQVNPGATSILVAGTAPFRAAGGWAFTGTQVFRYTGFSGSSLTGVPASGLGSIQQALIYNTVIAAAPCLIGIPASGEGAIRYAITKGEPVNLYVTVQDTDAQIALQGLLSAAAPVVRELVPPLKDERVNREQAMARATAYLTLRAYPSVRVGPYLSKDVNNRVGLDVQITINAPAVVNDSFQISAVTVSNFTPNIMPDYLVTGSDETLSIEELLARDPS